MQALVSIPLFLLSAPLEGGEIGGVGLIVLNTSADPVMQFEVDPAFTILLLLWALKVDAFPASTSYEEVVPIQDIRKLLSAPPVVALRLTNFSRDFSPKEALVGFISIRE